MQEKLKVLIIDDHPLMRRGIKQLVELEENFEVVADVGSGTEGISIAIQESPDLIILDLNMKGLSGLDTLKGLRAEGVDARILILTVSDAKNDIFTLIDAGADGYLLKDTEPDVLLEQIKRIAQGEVILSDSIKNLLLERKHTVDPMDSLTDREMDVLRLIATGLSNKQIAGQLFISEETVKVHIRNLLRKLNVHSRVAATVLFFERNGVEGENKKERVGRFVPAHLFVYLGTPRSKGIGSNGATEVGAGISLKIKINGLGGKIFSFRHKLPMPTN